MAYRNFVKLDPYERWILRVMQSAPLMIGEKKQPSSKVIGAILRDYFETVVKGADPNQLKELLRLAPPCPVPLPPEVNDIVNREQKLPRPARCKTPAGGWRLQHPGDQST
jgi:hypothetical protein